MQRVILIGVIVDVTLSTVDSYRCHFGDVACCSRLASLTGVCLETFVSGIIQQSKYTVCELEFSDPHFDSLFFHKVYTQHVGVPVLL